MYIFLYIFFFILWSVLSAHKLTSELAGYNSEKSVNSVMDLDDLDLSDDDEGTDFEMFNPGRAKISSTVVDSGG